jgi:hypothetical protein
MRVKIAIGLVLLGIAFVGGRAGFRLIRKQFEA